METATILVNTPPRRAINRRAMHRRPARRSIHLECRRGSTGLGANLAAGYNDISVSGVQLMTRQELLLGEEVEVVLEGYGFRGTIRRVGEVRWVAPLEGGGCRAGVRFNKYLTFRDLQNLTK
jgi:hypothetical protein